MSSLLYGLNGTIFAFGEGNSGKSFTIKGDI